MRNGFVSLIACAPGAASLVDSDSEIDEFGIDWSNVPPAVRADSQFVDWAQQAKRLEPEIATAIGRRREALKERQTWLFGQMRTRWNLVQGVPCS